MALADFSLFKFEGNTFILFPRSNSGSSGSGDVKPSKPNDKNEEIVIGSLKERLVVILLAGIICAYDGVMTGMWTTPIFAWLLIAVVVFFFGAKGLLSQSS